MKSGMPIARFCQALFFVLALVSSSPGLSQPTNGAPLNAIQRETLCSYAGDQFFPNMSIVLGALTVVAAIAIIVPSCLSIFNLQNLQKEVREYRIMRKELDAEFDKIKEKFKDYKTPEEILEKAESKAVKYTDTELGALRVSTEIANEHIINRLNALESKLCAWPPER
jgi:hypothetical protein